MRWLQWLSRTTRNGLGALDMDMGQVVDAVSGRRSRESETLGTVAIEGHGGLTGSELASAGASIAVVPDMVTIDDLHRARERLEAFVERAASDVGTRNLGGTYWDLQSAQVDEDEDEERRALAAEMERLGRVEGASVLGWVIRNAALRSQRPIAHLARPRGEVGADALALAKTLLESAQRLDPTDGGFLFSLRPRRGKRWRSRGRFGHLWVYGD